MLTALLNMLDNALLTTDSATRTLEHWCRTHHLAGGTPAAPAVRAILVDTPSARAQIVYVCIWPFPHKERRLCATGMCG